VFKHTTFRDDEGVRDCWWLPRTVLCGGTINRSLVDKRKISSVVDIMVENIFKKADEVYEL